jgi:exonuclease VII small subunit
MSAALTTGAVSIGNASMDGPQASDSSADNPYDLLPSAAEPSEGGSGTLVKRLRSNLGGRQQMSNANAVQTSEMVAKIFEPLKPARDGLAQMLKVLEPIGQVGELAEAFGPINAFQEKVASVVEPLRNLEREFNQFADAFEPMRILRDQMHEISTTFATNVAEFAQILEPLNRLRQQLDEAVHALEPADALYREFSKLSSILGKGQDEASDSVEAASPSERPGVLRLAAGRTSH